jgi:hypothetical protein
MRPSGRSQTQLEKAARPSLLRAGWYDGEFGQVIERVSQQGNEMFDARIIVQEADGTTHEIRDFLLDMGRNGLKFYRACCAVQVGDRYEAKQEISASDFIDHAVRVKIGIEKKRGYPDRNIIEDYAAVAAEVVKLRSAAS